MKVAYLVLLSFAVISITAIMMADDVTAESEQEHVDIADMTISEIFEYYKPLYFPGLCLSVSVFFFYKTVKYSFFKEPNEGKKSR